MRGQMLSHTFVVAFNVILILAIVLSLNYITSEYRGFISKSEAEEVCLTIKSAVGKTIHRTNYDESSYISGIVYIDIPERISNMKYRAWISGDVIQIDILDSRDDFNCLLDQPVLSTGSTGGGETKITTLNNKGLYEIEIKAI